MAQPDTLAGVQARAGPQRRRSEVEALVSDSEVHGVPIRLRGTWGGVGVNTGHAWLCRRSFSGLLERALEAIPAIRTSLGGNNWRRVDGGRWQGMIALKEGLALYELVTWVLAVFAPAGYMLHRSQYIILWGMGVDQQPHIDGHYVKPDRIELVQVDDAVSVLLYLSDREVCLCMHGEEVRLQVHAGDALVMSSRVWHRGIGSKVESAVVFLSLDRSVEADDESERDFYKQVPNLFAIPKEYVLHMHAGSIWGEMPGALEAALRGR